MPIVQGGKVEICFIALRVVFFGVLSVICLMESSGLSAAEWSIGIYEGASPLEATPAPGVPNPVLSADITGVQTETVADLFMLQV